MKSVQESAIEIIRTLAKAGYTAYFAGGWVRDFIMKHPSDDIDIATNAPPEVVIELFPRTVQVGLAFGVVIVLLHNHQFEVATFREDVEYSGGRRPNKIVLASAQEDANRRDFTINGMFYDPLTDTVHDFVNGVEDLKKGIIRTIGVPHDRFEEDRLRMIRAVRFASRFNFEMDEETKQAIRKNAGTLFPAVAMERVWQEFNKMAKFPRFDEAIVHMHELGLLPVIFPSLANIDTGIIKKRVANFTQFPKQTPTVLYLMELFPEMPMEELLELCQYLKMSGHEGKVVEFAYRGKQLLTKENAFPSTIEEPEWANFYAHRFFNVCFDVMTAQYSEMERSTLIQRHHARRERLLPHIQRLVNRKPLVTSEVLKDYGIPAGKIMGTLLKEAERLAITYNLHDPAEVIKLLKETPLWPK